MDTAELSNERARFATVMKARRSDKDLLELFHKLVLTDKFSDGAKPYCYADLVVEAAGRIADSSMAGFKQVLEDRSVGKKVRAGTDEATAEATMRALMKRIFASTPLQSEPLLQVFFWSERLGIGMDRGHTICLGLEGGITMEVMDEICDLTVYQYYPCMPRPKPQLQVPPEQQLQAPELLAA